MIDRVNARTYSLDNKSLNMNNISLNISKNAGLRNACACFPGKTGGVARLVFLNLPPIGISFKIVLELY